MKQFKFTLLLAAILMLILPSCDSDDSNEGYQYFSTFATFTGNRDGRAYFQTQGVNNGSTATLYVNGSLTGDDVKEGIRGVLEFITPLDFDIEKGGEMTNARWYPALMAAAEDKTTAEAQAANAEIYVQALYRTGTWINLQALMPSVKGRTMAIYVDQATLNSSTPHLYITTEVPENAAIGARANLYASFDISNIWALTTATGVVVHINNSNVPTQKEFTFLKSDK